MGWLKRMVRWRPKSFGQRFFYVSALSVAAAGMLTLVITMVLAIFFSGTPGITVIRMDDAAHSVTRLIADAWNTPHQWPAIFAKLRAERSIEPVSMSVINTDGVILYREGSLLDTYTTSSTLSQEQLLGLLAGKSNVENNWAFVVAPIRNQRQTLGILIADLKPYSSYKAANVQMGPLLLLLIPVVTTVLVCLVASFYLSHTLRRRLAELTTAIGQMADGDYRSRLPLNTQDEICQVAAAFNHMADKLEASRQQEETLHRLKRELITNVSHDLRGPLTSLQGYVEALQDGLAKDSDTVERYAAIIGRKSGQLSQLVDDLLLYSRLESGHLPLTSHEIDAADWLRQCLADVEPDIATANLILEADIPEVVAKVKLDMHKMQQVISNLVQNTLRYAPANSTLRATLTITEQQVLVSLFDEGPGLDEADIPYLFDRFYRGRNQAEGVNAGLGLAIAAQIVTAHGGRIWAENRPGGGAAFHFTLPLAVTQKAQALAQ